MEDCQSGPDAVTTYAGTAGDAVNRAVAKQLLTPPDWPQLAAPLIRVVQSTILDPEDAKTSSGLVNRLHLLAVAWTFLYTEH